MNFNNNNNNNNNKFSSKSLFSTSINIPTSSSSSASTSSYFKFRNGMSSSSCTTTTTTTTTRVNVNNNNSNNNNNNNNNTNKNQRATLPSATTQPQHHQSSCSTSTTTTMCFSFIRTNSSSNNNNNNNSNASNRQFLRDNNSNHSCGSNGGIRNYKSSSLSSSFGCDRTNIDITPPHNTTNVGINNQFQPQSFCRNNSNNNNNGKFLQQPQHNHNNMINNNSSSTPKPNEDFIALRYQLDDLLSSIQRQHQEQLHQSNNNNNNNNDDDVTEVSANRATHIPNQDNNNNNHLKRLTMAQVIFAEERDNDEEGEKFDHSKENNFKSNRNIVTDENKDHSRRSRRFIEEISNVVDENDDDEDSRATKNLNLGIDDDDDDDDDGEANDNSCDEDSAFFAPKMFAKSTSSSTANDTTSSSGPNNGVMTRGMTSTATTNNFFFSYTTTAGTSCHEDDDSSNLMMPASGPTSRLSAVPPLSPPQVASTREALPPARPRHYDVVQDIIFNGDHHRHQEDEGFQIRLSQDSAFGEDFYEQDDQDCEKENNNNNNKNNNNNQLIIIPSSPPPPSPPRALRVLFPPRVTHLLPHLAVGAYAAVSSPAKLARMAAQEGFTHFVNCCAGERRYATTTVAPTAGDPAAPISVLNLDVPDHENSYILLHFYEKFVGFIEEARRQHRAAKVFVHCVAGINRSISLVTAYLVDREQFSLLDAVRFLHSKGRTRLLENHRFRNELVDFALNCHPTQQSVQKIAQD